MEILKLTEENIQNQHICCAFSDKKCVECYQKKKEWLKTAFKDGYTFRKLNERGKVFIEYVPIEHAWLPIAGQNFMVVNCFWVSGKFKGKGWGKKLLAACIDDAQAAGMDGVVAISSDKKRPFMSDPKFFQTQGFSVIDEAPPFFKLYGMRFNEKVAWPQIMENARQGKSPYQEGIAVYYSNTCPFTDYWVNQHLNQYAAERNMPLHIHHIQTQVEAHQMPIPWIIHSVFYNGELVTLEVKPDRHLDKIINV